jgi:hypothetical protein
MSIQTDDLPVSLEPRVYESFVADAANWLDDGLYTPEDLELPDELAEYDIDRERFLADARDHAAEEFSDEPDPDDDDAIRQTGRIDWGALFEEFNFHTLDGAGNHAVPSTALVEAVAVSGQGIAGDPREHVSRAVEAGQLEAVRTVGKNGKPTLRGYRCPEVQPNV